MNTQNYKCGVCNDKKRVEILSEVLGRRLWFDCPACNPMGLRLELQQAKVELKVARFFAYLFAGSTVAMTLLALMVSKVCP